MSEERLIAVAAEDPRGLEGEVSAHFGRCPFFVLAEADSNTVTISHVVPNPYFGRHKPGAIPEFIHNLRANAIIAGGMGPHAIDIFHSFGIDVATGGTGTVDAVLKAYLRGDRRGVVACAHDHRDGCGGDGRDHR
jgi:predicted Fe-Mo cluster-binding NifX family protein